MQRAARFIAADYRWLVRVSHGVMILDSENALLRSFSVERQQDVLVVLPRKELAHVTEDMTRLFLAEWPMVKQQALATSVVHVVFDLAEIESVNSLLIKRILKLHGQLERHQRHLVLCNVSAAAGRLLRSVGVSDICTAFETRDDALDWLRRE